MTRPTRIGGSVPFLQHQLGGDPDLGDGEEQVDCCDEPEEGLPDRALDSSVFTVNAPSSGGIVQMLNGAWHPPGNFSESFAATPTNGSTMYAVLFQPSGATISTSGWTLLEQGSTTSPDAVGVDLWSKVAGASEPTTVSVSTSGGAGVNTRRLVLYEVAGSTDVHDDLDNQSGSSPLVGPTLDPTGSTGILIAAFTGQVATYAGDPTWTPLGDLETDTFSRQPGTRPVTWTGHQDLASGDPVTPSLTTTPLYAGRQTCSVDVVVSATPTAVEWNVPAPNTVDGDDSTYQEIDGPDILRLDLGGVFNIVKAVILSGDATAGSWTYTLRGANEADFSDAVTLSTETYAASGSFSTDTTTLLWTTDEAYQYFELTGSDTNRRIFSFELYEPDRSLGQDHTHDDIEDELIDLATAIEELSRDVVHHITANSSNTLLNPIVNFAAGSNVLLTLDAGAGGAIPSNTIRIHSTGGSGSISAGSNSTRVSKTSAAGNMTTLWSPADHVHDGIGTITASSSNTMQRGTFNLRAGSGIAIGLTDSDGDGEFDTATISTTSGGGGGGSSSETDPIALLFGTPDTTFEFSTSSLTGLTAMATAADAEDANTTMPGMLYIKRNGSATYRWVGRYATPPSEPFTAITKVHALPVANFNKAALFVGVATPGNMDLLCVIQDGTARRFTVERDSQTAFSSTVGSAFFYPDSPVWLAIKASSSSSYDYLYSTDGYAWRTVVAARNPSLTIASLGLAVNPDSSGTAMWAFFDYLRIWNSAKTFPGV